MFFNRDFYDDFTTLLRRRFGMKFYIFVNIFKTSITAQMLKCHILFLTVLLQLQCKMDHVILWNLHNFLLWGFDIIDIQQVRNVFTAILFTRNTWQNEITLTWMPHNGKHWQSLSSGLVERVIVLWMKLRKDGLWHILTKIQKSLQDKRFDFIRHLKQTYFLT